jgi:pimeloyl-ACP methyl ester carboxylesterase
MRSVNIDGRKLTYLDEGGGPPLLLLHGFPFAAEAFRPQLSGLSSKVRVIVPDHRGFGGSDPGEGPLEMSGIARDSLALLDQLGISSAVVGGVSMGGYAAMALVREDPARVKGLALLNTQAGADDAAGKERREAVARDVEANGVKALVDGMLPKLFAPGVSSTVKAPIEAIMRAAPPRGVAAASRGMGLRVDSREILHRFGGPALVVGGTLDAITPPEKAAQMAELLSGSRLLIIEGASHLAHAEAAEQVNAALLELVAAAFG